ncbi:MAG: hypothetical protein AAFY59_12605, partial [Pseudomonadota bacterium]
WADPARREIGSDLYTGGSGPVDRIAAPRDLFSAGPSLTLKGEVAKDIHAAGLSVDIEAATGGDLYAAGMSVTLRGAVSEDLTAAGAAVRTASTAETAGNARISGGSLTLEGPVSGSLTAAGGEILFNAPVSGDVWLVGGDISFGPDARIGGMLHYAAPEEIDVPTAVAAADRVTYERLDMVDMFREARREMDRVSGDFTPSLLTLAGGALLTIGFLVLVGTLFLAFAPAFVARLRGRIVARPWIVGLVGVVGLSALFGLVPVSAMTVVGLPFLPILLAIILVLWMLAHLLGAYSAAMGIARSLNPEADPGMFAKALILAVGVTFAALLNFVPILGWVVNFTLVLLGAGAISLAIFDRLVPERA